jgi:hypothetical protein
LSHVARGIAITFSRYILVDKDLSGLLPGGPGIAQDLLVELLATANPSVGGLDLRKDFILWLKF